MTPAVPNQSDSPVDGRARGSDRPYHYSFNSTGSTEAVKEGVQSFLRQRGYRTAPFTAKNSDYFFDKIFRPYPKVPRHASRWKPDGSPLQPFRA